MKKYRIAKTLPLLALFCLSAGTANAANNRFIWSGGGAGDGVSWSDAGNWGGEAATGSNLPGDVVDIPADATNVILQGGGTTTTTVFSDFTPANRFDILLIRSGHDLNVAANFDLTDIPVTLAQTTGNNDLNHSAGTFSSDRFQIAGAAGANGTYTRTGGNLSIVGDNNLVIGNNGGNGIFDQSAGATTVSGSITIGATGTFNLDGGSLAANTLNVNATGSFNWGDGTLTTFSNDAAGAVDQSNPGFTEVFVGRTLDVTGNIDTTVGQDGTLALGGIYLNSGKRFNQLSVSGTLDLNGASDRLAFDINPYLLRPNIGLAEDFGSLTLVTAGTLNGTFDLFDSVQTDLIGWTEYTGAFTTASALPVNTYFLEQTTGASGSVVFHYKVEGSVPEPGTMGFLLVGVFFIRRLRWMKEKYTEGQRNLGASFLDSDLEVAIPEKLASGEFYD